MSTNLLRPFLICLCFSALGVSQASAAILINGAGATFPYPLYAKWFSVYNQANPSIEINYNSIGSGGGIKQLTSKTVDFGASDAPMSNDELKAAPAAIVHVPTVLGAVAVTYNLPTVKTNLNLTGDIVADAFMGKITKWSDPRIALFNKGVVLPDLPIVAITRGDSSGTTFVFTEYLSKASTDWKATVGAGKAVKWPKAGFSARGNEGVTGNLKNTPGAIAYVELVYAISESLPVAKIKNRAGEFVEPSVKSVAEAAAGALKSIPDDYRVSIVDGPGKGSYPISSFTYILVYKKNATVKGAELIRFLEWSMQQGQTLAPTLNYAPLPAPLVAKVRATIKTLN